MIWLVGLGDQELKKNAAVHKAQIYLSKITGSAFAFSSVPQSDMIISAS